MIYTKESIRTMLETNSRAVERAILAIYNRQTVSEKQSGETRQLNGVGFSGADARLGTYYAEWIGKGRNLTEPHLSKARRMVGKYVGQLVSIANKE